MRQRSRTVFVALFVALLSVPIAAIAAPPAPPPPAGLLDTTFGGTGYVSVQGAGFQEGAGLAIQPDGAIVIGVQDVGLGDFMLARFLPSGAPDATFGTNGVARTDFGSQEIVEGIALQPDGKIVAAGSTGSGLSRDMIVARYDAAGALDPAFGSGGSAIIGFTEVNTAADDRAHAVTLDAAGNIVLAGISGGDMTAVRLTPSGALDDTFGEPVVPLVPVQRTGRARIVFGSMTSRANAVAIDASGAIGLAGTVVVNATQNFAVARLTPSGDPDQSFGAGGSVHMPQNGDDTFLGAGFDASGRFLAAGISLNNGGEWGAVARFLPSGALDATFAQNGMLFTEPQLELFFSTVTLQSDGKIVNGGGTSSAFDLLVQRLNADGTLDSTFGNGGRTVVPLPSFDGGTATALDAAGRVVMTGYGDGGAIVARFTPDPPPCTKKKCR